MRVVAATPRDDTIVRVGGDGDNFYMTWASDDSLLVALCDGSGLPGAESRELFNSRLYRTTDDPPHAPIRFAAVEGYPRKVLDLVTPVPEAPFYGFATLAIGDTIYQWLSTTAASEQVEDGLAAAGVFVGAKLIYSRDNGRHWHNQDGSSPVRWERPEQRNPNTMFFWHEPSTSFALPGVLQMGRAYEANTDGYVYVYAPNGVVEGTMNELVLMRMPVTGVLERGEREYFAGLNSSGEAMWTIYSGARRPTLRFPDGWVTALAHPYSWQPSIVYNAPLETYLLTSWGMPADASGWWFTAPSYLGIWASATPWGPWEQVYENTRWTPGGDQDARCYQPQFSPKWISSDGTAMWLVWTDFQPRAGEDFLEVFGAIRAAPTTHEQKVEQLAATRPYYSMNMQRVDLDVLAGS